MQAGRGATSVATRQITARLLTFCLPQAKQRQGTEVVTVDMLPVISQPACASM